MSRQPVTQVVHNRRRKPAWTAYCVTCNWVASFSTQQAADKAASEHKHN